jgi:hypothetical protein
VRTALRIAIALACGLLLAACGSSSHRSPKAKPRTPTRASATTPTSSGSLILGLTTSHSIPKVNANWPITVTAHTRIGRPVSGTVSYAFLFGGNVVATRPGGKLRSGRFHDELQFPAQAVGLPLTLRVIVKSGSRRASIDHQVTVGR